MHTSTPVLRLDTLALQTDYSGVDRGQDRSPVSTVRSRALSALPALRVSSATSPSNERAPLSPFLYKDVGADKDKGEMVKALVFQLDKISQRPRAPLLLETIEDSSSQNKRMPTLPAISRSLSNDLTGLVNPEGSDDEEDSSKFFSDDAAARTQNLLSLLLLSLDRGFNLFDEELSSQRDTQRDASKTRPSASPFRRRRRSLSAHRSRSPSPTTSGHNTRSNETLDRTLHLLQSLVSEDCRFPISCPRPGLPPNALQAFCLDVAHILAYLYEHSPAIMSQIAFAILPAFSTFHSHMISRLLQFFEECILRRMLSSAETFHHARDFSLLRGVPYIAEGAEPPIVAIQVDEAAEESPSHAHGEWRRWLPPSDLDRRLTSSNSPSQPVDLYQLVSIVSPLLSAALERLDLEEAPFDATHRFYRLLNMTVQLKPDSYLDILETVAYHVQPAKKRSLSILASYWPRALGHFTVSRAFSALNPHAPIASGPSVSTSSRMYAHQFVPWRFSNHAKPVVFDGSSLNDCRVCFNPILGFGLFCPFCMCAVHYDCYDYPDGNLVIPYSLETDQQKQRVAMYRFCHIIPARHATPVSALTKSKHVFRPVSIFALSLCFSCRLPLWGCWEQALKCDSCHLFAHAACLAPSDAHVDLCGTNRLRSEHLFIGWDTLRFSFKSHYTDFQHHDLDSSLRYEELSILYDILRVQKSILYNGVALGSVVINGYDALPTFELDVMIQNLKGALASPSIQLSANLDEFLQENRQHYSQHSVLYDWSTLTFIASSIRTPSQDISPADDLSSAFLAAHPTPITTTDVTSNPFEVLTLAHLRDTLAICFQVYSETSARLLLSHLRHTGFYERMDSDGVSHESFAAPQRILCTFPLPLGLDMSVDVEILVAAIEASLSDIDLSVNEAGFLLLVRRFWPNQMATGYALQRLAKAVLSWVISEDDHIAIILRDYLPVGRPLPGVRAGHDKQPWPFDAAARAIHATSVHNGGDYVAHRRALLQKYASVWLLALHDQDIPFYALTLYETVRELTEEASATDQTEQQAPSVFLADTSLRSFVRLNQASVVFTVFDDLLLRWLEYTSNVWGANESIPTLTRLLGREGSATSRASVTRGINITRTESSLTAGMDPWSIIMRAALSGQAALQQALQWLAMMATSGVDIPAAVFQQFTDLSSRFDLDVAHTVPLINSIFSSVWLRSLGRQEILGIIAALHIRLSTNIAEDLNQVDMRSATAMLFIRLSLAACLLISGCEREKLLSSFISDTEIKGLPSRRMLNARGAQAAVDPINLSTRFVAALGGYANTSQEAASTLVGLFFSMLMKDCQLLESYEVDNFVLRNASVLSTSAWKFYDIQAASLSSARPYILLHLLSVEPQPFQTLLDSELSASNPWEYRLKCLKQVFRILLDVTSPDFDLNERQWRTSVVFIFNRLFRTIWRDPQEEIRVSVDTWAQTLLTTHRDQIVLCWNEALEKAPVADRADAVATLVQLHSHFPTWQGVSWRALTNILMEEVYLHGNGGGSPRAAHAPMHSLALVKDSSMPSLDIDAIALHFSAILLCLKMVSSGVPVGSDSYITIKFHLLRAIGFKHVVSFPSISGQTSYVAFEGLGSTPELAWPCIDELLTVVDSDATTTISQSMMGPLQGEDGVTYMLVGTIFVDVLLAFINEYRDLGTLPYESTKALLKSLIIIVNKYDLDSKALVRLSNPLRRAIRRSLSLVLFDAPYDLRLLSLSVADAFIRVRPALAGAFVPDSIEMVSQLVSGLGPNREDILVQQAFSFLERTLSAYADKGILLALFKKQQDSSVHVVLKATTLDIRVPNPPGDLLLLRDALLKDTLARISDSNPDIGILQTVLWNLDAYLDMTHSQPVPISLMQCIGASFNSVIRRVADCSSDAFDPSVLLKIVSTAIQYNKANSRDLLLATETFLRATLSRFQISSASLGQILEITLDWPHRNKMSQGTPSGERSMNPVSHVFLEIYSAALRGETYMLSATLKAMTNAVSEKFVEVDGKNGADAVMWANKLPLDGLTYLLSHGSSQVYDEMDLDASLSVARLVLDGVEHSAEFFNRALQDQKSSRYLTLRSWNVLALASLHRTSCKTAHALMGHFSTFTMTFQDSLVSPWSLAPTDKASAINHCYTSIKLWLLLAKRLSSDANSGSDVSSLATFSVWNDLWPPFLHLLSELTAGPQGGLNVALATVATTAVADLLLFLRDSHSVIFLEINQQIASLRKLQSASRLELTNTKLDRTLREISASVPPVPWETLLEQARIDVIAAEKLELLESQRTKPRELGRSGHAEHRSSLVGT